MSTLHTLLVRMAAGLTLLSAAVVWPGAAFAQPDTEADFQRYLRWYALHLETARASDTALKQINACLVQRESELDKRITDLETLLGGLATEAKTQSAAVTRHEAAQALHASSLKEAESRFAQASQNLQNLPGREAYEKWKRSCDTRSKDYSLYVCSYGNRNAFSPIAKAEAELPGLQKLVETARGTLEASQAALAEVQGLWAQANQSLAATSEEKNAKDTEVSGVKRSLFTTRELISPARSMVATIEDVLNSASKAASEDDKRRAVRQLRAVSEGIDRSVWSGKAAVERLQQAILGEQGLACPGI